MFIEYLSFRSCSSKILLVSLTVREFVASMPILYLGMSLPHDRSGSASVLSLLSRKNRHKVIISDSEDEDDPRDRPWARHASGRRNVTQEATREVEPPQPPTFPRGTSLLPSASGKQTVFFLLQYDKIDGIVLRLGRVKDAIYLHIPDQCYRLATLLSTYFFSFLLRFFVSLSNALR